MFVCTQPTVFLLPACPSHPKNNTNVSCTPAQESKNGHALLRKVKQLAEENEDLGRQQRENKHAAQVRGRGGQGGRGVSSVV